MGSDGFALYEALYPRAIEHYVKGKGFTLSNSDKDNVMKAAQHFAAYWHRDGRIPQDEDGKPDWWTVYGMIQDHFRQWTKGMIQ